MEGEGGEKYSRYHFKTEGRQALTSDHDSAEGCRGEGGDDRGRLWLQTILHHNQTLKHQVTLHHITERGGGRGRDGGSRMYICMQFTVYHYCDLHVLNVCICCIISSCSPHDSLCLVPWHVHRLVSNGQHTETPLSERSQHLKKVLRNCVCVRWSETHIISIITQSFTVYMDGGRMGGEVGEGGGGRRR